MTKEHPSGLLSKADRPFKLDHFKVEGQLGLFVEYLWSVQWQLPAGEKFTSVNIPYPCAHIAYEQGDTGIFGPVKGTFNKELEGSGFVLGARFKSGLFCDYAGLKPAEIVGRKVDLSRIFPNSSDEIDQKWCGYNSPAEVVDPMISILSSIEVSEEPSELAMKAHRIIQLIETDRSILAVISLCEKTGMSERALERLFKEFIGLTPKWVIRLFRLQQLADQMMQSPPNDWAALAQDLGYFDQAHCIRDFRSFTGKTPTAFL